MVPQCLGHGQWSPCTPQVLLLHQSLTGTSKCGLPEMGHLIVIPQVLNLNVLALGTRLHNYYRGGSRVSQRGILFIVSS